MGNLTQELVDKVISHVVSGKLGPHPTNLMPQEFWKQVLVRLPLLWDLDMEQIQLFPKNPDREWDWERLARLLLCGPGEMRIECEKDWHNLWDYSFVGLDLPPGLTNRRRIWQILENMDPKELDVLDEPDFIVLDDHLDRFIARTVQDGVNVEDPETLFPDSGWWPPTSALADNVSWEAPDLAVYGPVDALSGW